MLSGSIYKKGLVVGIIILFFGLSIQPTFAVENKSSADTTQNEEDCGCQVVSDINLIKLERELNRLKVYTRILSLLYKHNPEIQERIKQLADLPCDCETDDTNGGSFDTLCKLLEPLWILGNFLTLLKIDILYDTMFQIGRPFNLDCYWHPFN